MRCNGWRSTAACDQERHIARRPQTARSDRECFAALTDALRLSIRHGTAARRRVHRPAPELRRSPRSCPGRTARPPWAAHAGAAPNAFRLTPDVVPTFQPDRLKFLTLLQETADIGPDQSRRRRASSPNAPSPVPSSSRLAGSGTNSWMRSAVTKIPSSDWFGMLPIWVRVKVLAMSPL